MDPNLDGLNEIVQDVGSDRTGRLLMQFGIGEFRRSVDCDEKEQLSLLAANLADIDVEEADRVVLDTLLPRRRALALRQAGDDMTLQKPMKAGTGQTWDMRLKSEQHVVERQQRLLAEGDDRSLLQRRQHRRSGFLGTHPTVLDAGAVAPLQDCLGIDSEALGKRRDRGFRSL